MLNWRGRPLTSHEVIVNLIANTTTRTGWRIEAALASGACGLWRDAQKFFALPRGYYGLESIFLLLALLALARVKSVEQLRYWAPGEWGKLLGLDRGPEVRTLRTKLALLTATDAPAQGSAQLCAEWMQDDPESAGI